jgi:hypothetical protein
VCIGLPFLFWKDITTALRGYPIRMITKKHEYEKRRIAIHAPTGLHLHQNNSMKYSEWNPWEEFLWDMQSHNSSGSQSSKISMKIRRI